jgi:hypothetical protein
MPTSKTWPGGATGATPSSYSIPLAGDLNWAALSDFLVALADGAQSTTFQKFAVRKALTTPITVSSSSDCVIVSDLTSAGAVAVNLPAGANKQVFFVLDGKGDAGTNNITITPNGAETIGGAATLVLNHNSQSVMLVYNSSDTDWKIVANVIKPGTITPSDIVGVIPASKGGTGVSNNDAATLTRSGNHALTLTTTGSTNVTLPTSGTLAKTSGDTFTSPIVTGQLLLQNPSGSQPTLALSEDPDNGTNKLVMQAAANMSADYTLTYPAAVPSAGYALVDAGAGDGVLAWSSVLVNPLTGNTINFTIQANGSASLELLQSYTATAGNGPNLEFDRSRNATLGSHTIVQSGDSLGSITFKGSNGTSFDSAAQIISEVDGTPGSSSDMPGRIRFLTSADGSVTLTEAARITNGQYVLVAATSPNTSGAKFQVGGSGVTFASSPSLVSDANTMEGYKESDFTPSVSFSGGTTGLTLGSPIGRYTRTGRVVVYNGGFTVTNIGSSSGNLRINLPYSLSLGGSSGNTLVAGTIVGQSYNSLVSSGITCFGNQADSYVTVAYNAAGTGTTLFTNTQSANNMFFVFCFTFTTADAF